MHQTALHFGKAFFDTYLPKVSSEEIVIVDVGSQDVNGSLRSFAPSRSRYIGVDFVEGAGVDIVLRDPYALPFSSDSVDAVVCSSVFEHSEFFWLLFLECLRILKPAGLLYLNAPSNGMVHRYPMDGWRFYPDAGHALVNWARRHDYSAILFESFLAPKMGGVEGEGMWNDFVAVFLKDERYLLAYSGRIVDSTSGAEYIYAQNRDGSWVQGGPHPDTKEILARGVQVNELRVAVQSLKEQLVAEQESNDRLRIEAASIRASRSWRFTAPLRVLGRILKRNQL